MMVHTFTVDSAAEAVELIRSKLGPDAVVLNVRKLPVAGVSRLWRKPRLEVLAAVPSESGENLVGSASQAVAPIVATESTGTSVPMHDPLSQLRREMSEIRAEVLRGRDPDRACEAGMSTGPACSPGLMPEPVPIEPFVPKDLAYPGHWQAGPILEATGLQPRYAMKVVERLCEDHGETGPEALNEQLGLAMKVLRGEWTLPPSPTNNVASGAHVLIGPAGSGKTTILCKWLAQLILVEGRSVAVFRLDGETANTGELLSVHAEVLGVPVQRSLTSDWRAAADVVFVDLPGVAHTDRASMIRLRDQIQGLRPAQIHLVLNVAYETALFMAQFRGFSGLKPDDWMATHLDEEPRWGKLWNGVMGTNCPLGWMGVGQNIPGMFHRADPDRILNRQFNR